MFDAIEYRGFEQEIVEELAKFAGVPVFNGLTAEFHPTQMIADTLTMREHCDKLLHDISYACIVYRRSTIAKPKSVKISPRGIRTWLTALR
jgi:ornithine carbamoyltransferase